jgi:MerR family transcriptional regulator, thiopeptide resistance regulator
MAYSVKQVAKMSGVSVRTLHFYHETGLLKPARTGANGYRFYEEPQLLLLQQILFYRELGFELKQIKRILTGVGFEKIIALESHRKVLVKNLARTRSLIATIDRTIEYLKVGTKMKAQEMFGGFTLEEQARHEQYLIDRCGPEMKKSIDDSRARVKHWTKARWEESSAAFNEICRDLVTVMDAKLAASSPEAQAVIRRHFEWLKQFWTPGRESYAGHSQLIVSSELRKAYETHHPALPEFVSEGIRTFAERELP